jgi:hypothetical protein
VKRGRVARVAKEAARNVPDGWSRVLAAERIHGGDTTVPVPDEIRMTNFECSPIRYRNVISVLKIPFYTGVYIYGKSEKRTSIVEGRARRSYGHASDVADPRPAMRSQTAEPIMIVLLAT